MIYEILFTDFKEYIYILIINLENIQIYKDLN